MRTIFLLLCGVLLSCTAAAKLPRWDAAPAMGVVHLQGEHAGTVVCPMCRYGYDAGVLALLPPDIAPADARRVADALRRSVRQVDDPRFRGFLVFLGAVPQAPVLDAVRGEEPGWQVGWLPPHELSEASAGFRMDLSQVRADRENAYAYVFAQRRVLWAFPPQTDTATWSSPLQQHAAYAMRFLQDHYAEAVNSDDPDQPRGGLWLAPAQLTTMLDLQSGTSRVPTPAGDRAAARLCLVDSRRAPLPMALLMVRAAASAPRADWARSDERGCVGLAGAALDAALLIEVSRPLRPTQEVEVAPVSAGETQLITLQDEAGHVTRREPVVGGCQGCEAAFVGLPDRLESSARIGPATQPGAPLLLEGTVRDAAGVAQPGIVLYAYQTDAGGVYPPAPALDGDAARHGRLRAWARTDAHGHFSFRTIRPGAYPGADVPQHIHLHVIEPGRCTYYLGDVLFDDDPLLDAAHRREAGRAPGGSGLVVPRRAQDGTWRVRRDVVLGRNVAGYSTCDAARAPDAAVAGRLSG